MGDGMRRSVGEGVQEHTYAGGFPVRDADVSRGDGALAEAVVPLLGTLTRGPTAFRCMMRPRAVTELLRTAKDGAEGQEAGQEQGCEVAHGQSLSFRESFTV
jgi:hypothetical protein